MSMELIKASLINTGIVAPGDVKVVAPSGGTWATYYPNIVEPENYFNTIATAEASLRSGMNDVVILAPELHSQAAALTWNVNMAHLIGAHGPGKMNLRSRIGHSANFATLLTVSGYGNSFQNLFFQHGRGSATNLTCLNITGARNSFINCHFGGPMHATEGDTANYTLVNIASAENYFKGCFFGVDTVAWDDGYAVMFGAGGDNSQRTVFEDCIFLMQAAASPAVHFLGTTAGLGEATAVFLNCHFINSGTALTYAIDGAGMGNFQMYFDNRCSFMGCTDVVALAYEAYVNCGGVNLAVNQVNTASNKLFNMLTTNPDVS